MMRNVWMIVAVCLLALAPLRTAADTVEQGRAAYLAADFDAAYRILQPHADAGDGEALFMLGLLELGGLGTARDLRSSAQRLLEAGDAGVLLGHVAIVLPVLALIDGDLDLPLDGGADGWADIENVAGVVFGGKFEESLPQITVGDIRDGLVPLLRRMVDAGIPEARLAFASLVHHEHVSDVPPTESLFHLGPPDPRLSSPWLVFVAMALEPAALPIFLPDSVSLALAYWRAAAERGVMDAQLRLGQLHREGEFKFRAFMGDETTVPFENDLAQSLRWYRAAAERGNAEAQYWVGQFHRNGEGLTGVLPRDDDEARRWFTLAAEKGHVEAMYALAMAIVTSQEAGLGNEWMIRAAEAGHPGAALFIATILSGQDRNAEAYALLLRPAEAGDAGSQYLLGNALATGSGVPVDLAAAAGWFRRAAEGGDVGGQLAYGRARRDGRGVAHNQSEGLRWIRRAADAGNAAAQADFALAVFNGEGIARNTDTALTYARMSAVQGNRSGQYYLGQFLLIGSDRNGTPPVEALGWLLIARQNGTDDPDRISRAERALDATQRARARVMARRCLESSYQNCVP